MGDGATGHSRCAGAMHGAFWMRSTTKLRSAVRETRAEGREAAILTAAHSSTRSVRVCGDRPAASACATTRARKPVAESAISLFSKMIGLLVIVLVTAANVQDRDVLVLRSRRSARRS